MSRLQKKRMLLAVAALTVVLVVLVGAVWGMWHYRQSGKFTAQRAEGCYLLHAGQKDELLKAEDIAVFQYDMEKEGPYLTAAQAEGSRLALDTAEGTRLMEDTVYEGDILSDDMRFHKYTCIKLTERMEKGDYVDIRISFSNGADFILLSKKQIQDITLPKDDGGENAIWLNVSEEEILRLSSAVVDAYLNEGSSIYAIQYIQKGQQAAIMNYKVNEVIEQLIADNPNIVKKAENVLEWELWEEWKGEGNTLSIERENSYQAADDTGETLPEREPEEEIVYFD